MSLKPTLEDAILACWSVDSELDLLNEAILEKGLPVADAGVALSGLAILARLKFEALAKMAEGSSPELASAASAGDGLPEDLLLLSRSAPSSTVDELSNALLGLRTVHDLRFNELWAVFERQFEAPKTPKPR